MRYAFHQNRQKPLCESQRSHIYIEPGAKVLRNKREVEMMSKKWWYQSKETGKMESSYSFAKALRSATPRSKMILKDARRIGKKLK